MDTFNIAIPDKDAEKDVKVRVHRTSMGDGYVVEVPDGLNPLETTYPVVFSNRPRTVVASIERFLEGKAGRRFLWTGPDGVTGQYVCQKWKASYLFEMNCSISATFEKRHG